MKNPNRLQIARVLLASVALLLAVAHQAQAVIWNVDSSKTVELYTDPAGPFSATDPIDLGKNNDYVPFPFFSLQMSGYTSGSQIASVDSFNFSFSSIAVPTSFNADIYAFKVSSNGTVSTTEYNNSPGTLLQTSILTPLTSPGTISLNATGRSNLLAYLQTNYATNDFVTFTLRSATALNGSSGLYRLATPGSSLTSSLETTAVPEPSTVAMLFALGIGTAFVRSRRVSRAAQN